VAGDDLEHRPRLATIRIGEFDLCSESGVLSRSGAGTEERLAPKPAALLAMLVERRGGLVTRTEIREQLWGDVTVDFDNSLNYCIRQVRIAFGDNAVTPQYVETVPGRGYRLKPELFPPPSTATAAIDVESPRRGTSRRRWMTGVGIGVAMLGLGGVWFARRDRDAKLRIAILPFADAALSPALALRCSQLEARLLAGLTTRGRHIADVVGPRTTGPLVAQQLQLKDLAAKLGAHYIVNARFLGDPANAEILFELIRSSDGAHIYVKRVSDVSAVDALSETIVSAMLAALEAERARA